MIVKKENIILSKNLKEEEDFIALLVEFLEGWNVSIIEDAQLCNGKYSVKYLLNGYIIPNYDNAISKEVQEEIQKWSKKWGYSFKFISIELGKSIRGLHDITSQMVAWEDIYAWGNECVGCHQEYWYNEIAPYIEA